MKSSTSELGLMNVCVFTGEAEKLLDRGGNRIATFGSLVQCSILLYGKDESCDLIGQFEVRNALGCSCGALRNF